MTDLEPEHTFVDRLVVKLTLTLAGTTIEVPAGSIKNFRIEHACHGFSASIDWWFVCLKSEAEDELFAKFATLGLVETTLTIDRAFDKVGASAEPLVLKGLVRRKRVLERSIPGMAGEPVLHRHYFVEIADRAQVLWRQHRPIALYVDKTLKDVLEDNKPKGVTIKYSWAPLTRKHAVLSLPLAADGRASFYDYVCWLLRTYHGGLFYDADQDRYELVDSKLSFATTAPNIEDVRTLAGHFPRTPRDEVNVLNGWSEAKTPSKTLANRHGVSGVRRDFLMVSSVSADMDARTTLERKRHEAAEPGVHLLFSRYPSVTFKPTMIAEFAPAEGFSDKLLQHGKKYRVTRLSIAARAVRQEATDDDGYDTNAYEMTYAAELELKSDSRFLLPPYVSPHWPVHVEGKIVSETGKTTEGTYQYYEDAATSLAHYKVEVPLFNKQKVIVAYHAGLLSGHFYFPAYRDARVRLALEFNRAWISRFLDWRPGARLPQNTQGNHLLFGKQATDQTSMAHTYVEAKPQLRVARTNKQDKQLIEVSEGTITFRTE